MMSWELFTKHLIRDIAMEGNLKCIMPIGKAVGRAINDDRLRDVLSVAGCEGVVEQNPPTPNAWVEGKGGYRKILKRIVRVGVNHS